MSPAGEEAAAPLQAPLDAAREAGMSTLSPDAKPLDMATRNPPEPGVGGGLGSAAGNGAGPGVIEIPFPAPGAAPRG
jgi:hypothetical protein